MRSGHRLKPHLVSSDPRPCRNRDPLKWEVVRGLDEDGTKSGWFSLAYRIYVVLNEIRVIIQRYIIVLLRLLDLFYNPSTSHF